MLKIKDNVDLKELEKFGFMQNQFPNKEVVSYRDNKNILNINNIIFYKKNRIIKFDLQNMSHWCNDIETLDQDYEIITNSYKKFKNVIDDLIKADLVEKIEE